MRYKQPTNRDMSNGKFEVYLTCNGRIFKRSLIDKSSKLFDQIVNLR